MANISELISKSDGHLYLPDLGEVCLFSGGTFGSGVSMDIKDGDGVLLDSLYLCYGFDGKISMDLSMFFEQYFTRTLPGTFTIQGLVRKFTISSESATYTFSLHNYPEKALDVMSDVDMLRVPRDYMFPYTRCKLTLYGRYGFMNAAGQKLTDYSGLGNSTYPVSKLSALPDDAAVPVRPYLEDAYGNIVTGPLLSPCDRAFEQYMFANSYGGFDNIPMDGKLSFAPVYEFAVSETPSGHKRGLVDAEPLWTQNSGVQTRKTIEALSTLILSEYIWHLKDGEWRRIVITECDISHSSDDSLHSVQFTYKYVNE